MSTIGFRRFASQYTGISDFRQHTDIIFNEVVERSSQATIEKVQVNTNIFLLYPFPRTIKTDNTIIPQTSTYLCCRRITKDSTSLCYSN